MNGVTALNIVEKGESMYAVVYFIWERAFLWKYAVRASEEYSIGPFINASDRALFMRHVSASFVKNGASRSCRWDEVAVLPTGSTAIPPEDVPELLTMIEQGD